MIFLDDGHMIIEQTLAAKLAPGYDSICDQFCCFTILCFRAKREPVDLRVADFEGGIKNLLLL